MSIWGVPSGLAPYTKIALGDHFLYCLPEPWEVEIPGDSFNGFVHSLVAMCWGFMDIFDQLFLEFDRHID